MKRYNLKSKIDITLYQPFLDAAIALIKNRLDLQYYPIPEGFELKEATVGQGKKQTQDIVTTSYAFASPNLPQFRAAHVQGGSSLQVLNFVLFRHLNFDLPFFGADLVTLAGDHLIALDMQPLQDLGTQPKKTRFLVLILNLK